MAFGDQAGKAAIDDFVSAAPGIIDKLTAAGHTVEADAIASLHAALTDGISQLGGVVQADLAPVVEESEKWRELIAGGFHGTFGGIPFTILPGVPSAKEPVTLLQQAVVPQALAPKV